MAPLSLSCPLCCNEKFSSHYSLKYHLLSMIDNLLCPSCNERCDDLMDMADHLGRECKNLKKLSNNIQCEKTSDSKENNSREVSEEPQEVLKPNKESDESNVKVEIQDDSFECNQIGNTIIDIDESGKVNENQTEKKNESPTERKDLMMYTCEMCNVSFNSVQDHLAKFHEGEEVLLETEQDEDDDSQVEDGTLLAFHEGTDDDADDDIFEVEASIVGNSETLADASERAESYLGQTISEQELTDKDGLNYTRKVVKVGTNWISDNQKTESGSTKEKLFTDRGGLQYTRKVVKVGTDWISDNEKTESSSTKVTENNEEIEPNTTKYIVEEGKVRQMTEEEASEITDKSTIIEVHICPNCNLQFPNLSHFKKHNCNNAKPILSKRKDRKNQLLKIKEELSYQCTFCLAVYSSLIALNDHMKAHLIQDQTGMVQKKTITMTLHVCEICNTKFPTYKQLRLHSRMHEPVKTKQVDPPVSYNIMGQSNEENEEPNNTERETFQCPTCEKLYDKEYEDVHMKSHGDQENIVCLVCNRKFDTKENLNMHMKAHSSSKKFACSYCKKPFNNYPALEDHVVNQCQKRQYECQYCGRRFGRPHEKVKHERIHTGEKPHVCQICGRAFRVSYCLTLHMRTHTNTRPYTCQHCGKRFKSHSVFNHHMQTHSDERNYKCSFCPKAFKTAVQLAGHKNSHTKPFSCNECNRPFASLYAVRAHMETHKRDNNLKFDCWICGASYARSFALRDHMSTVHGQSSVAPGSFVDLLPAINNYRHQPGKFARTVNRAGPNKITEKEQDSNKILLELENTTDETQMEHIENQGTTEEHNPEIEENQILTEGEEYHMTGNEDEVSQVLGSHEDPEDGFVVHLQEVETSVHVEDSQMEVIES